jgi:hypothetical protein
MSQDYSFEFTEADPKGVRNKGLFGAITLNLQHLTVAEDVYQGLGAPKRVKVEFDVKRQAIRLTPILEGGHLLTSHRAIQGMRSKIIRITTIQRELPLGRYIPIDGNTFIHVSQYQ